MYEASERDFRVVCVDDAVSGLYEQGRRELDNIGVVRTTAFAVEGYVTRGSWIARDQPSLRATPPVAEPLRTRSPQLASAAL